MPRHMQTLRPWLGRIIEVVVDRPKGSAHPGWPSLIYPIDYGYVPNTLAGDNSPIDVYLIDGYSSRNTDLPRVIGAVDRLDDVEFKLIASRDSLSRSLKDLFELVSFVEKYFDVEMVNFAETARFIRGVPL